MVVINNSPPLCNYELHLSTIFTSTDYYGEVIYLPHHNRTVITTYSTYIHHTTESCKETKRPPTPTTTPTTTTPTTTTTTSTTTTESCKETKRPPSSAITSERLSRLRLKRQVSVHSLAYGFGVLNQAICIAPLSTFSALPSRLECTSLQFAARANLDSPRPKPQDCFSVRHLDDRTDGVSRYRGKTMSFQRNTLSASLYIPFA